MRLRTLLIAVLLLAGLAYLGTKAYVHYRVQSTLDRIVARTGGFARVEYGAISSSLAGSVRVQDITVEAFNDEVKLGAVEVQTPNVLYLLRMVSNAERGRPPEFLELAVQGLELNVDGPLLRLLDAAMEAKAPRLPAGNPCAGQLVFGPRDWRAMGYARLVSDLRARIDSRDAPASFGMDVEATTRDMGSMSVALRVSGIAPRLDAPPQTRDALLKRLEVVYRDDSYTRRLVDYCAGAAGTDAAGHVAAVMGADARYYMHTWGVVPGDGLRSAYGEFLRAPGEIRVLAEPSTPVELATLHLYSPDDIVALLNLQVSFNGTTVKRPQVSFRPELLEGKPVGGMLGAVPGMGTAPAQPSSAPTPKARVAAPAFAYRAVDKTELGRYVGRTVRLVTADRQVREGVLSGSDRERAVVERRMYGGSMAVPVPMEQIHKAEVLLPAQP